MSELEHKITLCRHCIYMYGLTTKYFECRRRSPIASPDDGSAWFPHMDDIENDGCGEGVSPGE